MDAPVVDSELDAALAAWVRHLNAGEYFEAHEALEGVWLTATEPDRTFLKGLIHIAVVLRHHERGNAHGTRVKHASAIRYLAPYLPEYRGIALAALLADLTAYLVAYSVEEQPASGRGSLPGLLVQLSAPLQNVNSGTQHQEAAE